VAILHPEVQLNSSEDLDKNRRKLAEDECLALLGRPLTGVFSTISKSGWIHSVPVFFDYVDSEVRVLAEAAAVKTRNAERTGHATLCVETTDGSVRSYVSVSGPVTVRRPPTAEDLRRAVFAHRLLFWLGRCGLRRGGDARAPPASMDRMVRLGLNADSACASIKRSMTVTHRERGTVIRCGCSMAAQAAPSFGRRPRWSADPHMVEGAR
jgi:hypothetical protein